MRTDPQKNIYDVEMKWILHVRDHFSKLSQLMALPSKEAKYVAHELKQYFRFIGPCAVLQSDNGKEFTANIVKHVMAILNARMAIIHGRPRTPRDQVRVVSRRSQRVDCCV